MAVQQGGKSENGQFRWTAILDEKEKSKEGGCLFWSRGEVGLRAHAHVRRAAKRKRKQKETEKSGNVRGDCLKGG